MLNTNYYGVIEQLIVTKVALIVLKHLAKYMKVYTQILFYLFF